MAQPEVSKHLRGLAGAHYVFHSPERRRDVDGDEDSSEPRLGSSLVPYRVHEPAAHAQHLSQLQYETYMKRKAAPEDPMQPARAEASRPRSKAVAAASDGSDLEGLSSALLREGLLDLKAWIRFANTASNQRSMAPRKGSKDGPQIRAYYRPTWEKVLAVVAMLYDVGDVRQVDLSGMGLETDLSFNRNLVSLASLASCSAVEAIRLGSCLKLTDLKPLASLTKLSADAGPLLAGGYEPPPNPMHDVLAGQDAPEASAQEPPHVAAKPADSPPRPGGPKVPPSGAIPGMPAASLPGTKAKAKKEPGTTAEGTSAPDF
eukprot:s2_g65.t1